MLRIFLPLLLMSSAIASPAAPAPFASIPLWPDGAPGNAEPTLVETQERDERQRPGGEGITLIRNVTAPTLTLYRPAAEVDTGATVLVCPGGGYYVLAYDLEGTEVCAWLNSLGVTAALLKYRVPRREDRTKHLAPLEDAQQAVRLLRQRAPEWGLDPQRIGALGFSAGGHLTAALSTTPASPPAAEAVTPLVVDTRPNFAILIYPAYLTGEPDGPAVAPELPVDAGTPPTFIAITQDDAQRAPAALRYYLALHQAGVSAELHVYPIGGHGYGLRRTALPVTTWPDRVADWLQAGGWLSR